MDSSGAFTHRKCNGCGWELSPTKARAWTLNTLLPLGSTATYECAICGNVFLLRSPWHLIVLAVACVLYGWIVATGSNIGSITLALLVLLVLYSAYAIAEHVWNSRQNPTWSGSGDDP